MIGELYPRDFENFPREDRIIVNESMENDFVANKEFENYTVGELVNNVLMTCAFVCDMRRDIKELKKRKFGKWVSNMNGTFICSRCGCKHSRSRFCPDCGSYMKGENE